MPDLKISELDALVGSDLVSGDLLVAVDNSASETKKLTVGDLIANGVTLISDDTIPGAKILFAAGDVTTTALADDAVTADKIAENAVTAGGLADGSTVELVSQLPDEGNFTGQFALDTTDSNLYVWNGSAWVSLKAAGSINTVEGSTTGEVNIVATTNGSTVTISATLDDTTAAAQFLAGPTGAAGAVSYRTISGTDLPAATTTAKGGVIVNGSGLTMDSETIEIDNSVTASSTHHVVTYNAQGLVTGGRIISSADLPIATASAVGGVIAGDGLAVDATGNLSIDNTIASGTYAKVTVSAQGVVTAGEALDADDIPNHSAAKLTSGTVGSSLIANSSITASKLANQSTTKFGGADSTNNVVTFPDGDFQGQFFFDELNEDLYIYTGTAYLPITIVSGNLVLAGTYNAGTNLLDSVTTEGSAAGFTNGAALPAPSESNQNYYVVVSESGTGSGTAPAVSLAPPDMLISIGTGSTFTLIDVSNAIAGQTASNITFTPANNISSSNVQAALEELDNEKLSSSSPSLTGTVLLGQNAVLVFEGSTDDDYETTITVVNPTADRTITVPNITGTLITTGDSGTVTSTMIANATIVNADISASADIAVNKLANGTARQLLQTNAAGNGVEFTSNVDIPGTLDVASAGTFDSTLSVAGLLSANGKLSYTAGTAAAPSLFSGSDTDTGIYAPASDQFGIATAGTSRIVVNASGNVGIAKTDPTTKLDVNGTVTATGFAGDLTGNADTATALETARNINGTSFDGSADIVIGKIPQNSQTAAYTLVAADAGKHVNITTGGVTVPSGVFSIGDAVSIYNDSASNQTITQGSSVTLREAGTPNTGNRTLNQRGICTVLCVASNEFVITGVGIS